MFKLFDFNWATGEGRGNVFFLVLFVIAILLIVGDTAVKFVRFHLEQKRRDDIEDKHEKR